MASGREQQLNHRDDMFVLEGNCEVLIGCSKGKPTQMPIPKPTQQGDQDFKVSGLAMAPRFRRLKRGSSEKCSRSQALHRINEKGSVLLCRVTSAHPHRPQHQVGNPLDLSRLYWALRFPEHWPVFQFARLYLFHNRQHLDEAHGVGAIEFSFPGEPTNMDVIAMPSEGKLNSFR
jgi:hypothetical protein